MNVVKNNNFFDAKKGTNKITHNTIYRTKMQYLKKIASISKIILSKYGAEQKQLLLLFMYSLTVSHEKL